MKKIAIIMSDPSKTGGMETVVNNLITELKTICKDKYEVTILLSSLYTIDEKKYLNVPNEVSGTRVVNLSKKMAFNRRVIRTFAHLFPLFKKLLTCRCLKFLYWRKQEVKSFKFFFDKENIDIAIAINHPEWAISLAMTKPKNKKMVKLVWWHTENKFMFEHTKNKLYENYAKKYISDKYFADSIVLTQNMRKDYAKDFKLKSTVIPNGTKNIDVNIKDDVKKVKKFGFVARLTEYDKRVTHAVKAVIPHPNLKLYVYGSGSASSSAKRISGEYTNIIFKGSEKNKEKIYSKFSCLVVTSKSEGFGLVIIEAMSYGIPVIAYDIPNVNEIIKHGENGLLVESGNIAELSRVIRELSKNLALYKELSKNAFETSKLYSSELMAHKWDIYFHQIKSKK